MMDEESHYVKDGPDEYRQPNVMAESVGYWYGQYIDSEREKGKWVELFNMSCKDRDKWQQQCDELEQIIIQQRTILRQLKGLPSVVIDAQYRDEVLEAATLQFGSLSTLDPFQCASEKESEAIRSRQTARDEGSNYRETSDCDEGI